MPQHPTLIRKRLIPLETLRLERDVVVHRSDRLLVTRWTTIKPKKELHHGSSCFLLKEGWKEDQPVHRPSGKADLLVLRHHCHGI